MYTYTFHIDGIHCTSCALLIEHTVSTRNDLKYISISTSAKTLTVQSTEEITSVLKTLNNILEPHGYSVQQEKPQKNKIQIKTKDVITAFSIFIIFIFLQNKNFLPVNTTGTLNGYTIIFVGVAASLSSCMAVVGSLILSLPNKTNTIQNGIRTHAIFHISRLISFILLGATIGALGSTFKLSASANLLLHTGTALLLLILGLNMLGLLPKNWKPPTLPKSAGSLALRTQTMPFILGMLTFILPCGFTQSMQIYALTTQSAAGGAFTMGVFALGTLPVLLLLSFGAILGKNTKKSFTNINSVLGILVIFFGLYTLYNILAVSGIVPPLF